LSFASIFLKSPEECDFCWSEILELIFICISRFLNVAYFSVFFLFLNDIYPARIKGLGSGTASSFGTIASTVNPYLFALLKYL
jgi:hypothetical protein